MAIYMDLHAGNSGEWQVPITDPDGTPRDLTGVTALAFLVKRHIDDPDVDALMTAIPTVYGAPTDGVVAVGLPPAASANVAPGVYVWGMQLKEATGQVWEFPTPDMAPGRFTVHRSIVVAVP